MTTRQELEQVLNSPGYGWGQAYQDEVDQKTGNIQNPDNHEYDVVIRPYERVYGTAQTFRVTAPHEVFAKQVAMKRYVQEHGRQLWHETFCAPVPETVEDQLQLPYI